MRKLFLVAIALMLSSAVMAQIYVSPKGKNKNPGTKELPKKNISRAIKAAKPGDKIYVAEGNYQGVMKKGYVDVNKAVEIYGGYSADFSTRDVLKHKTTFIPAQKTRGTAGSRCLFDLQNVPKGTLIIDGIMFDRGETNNYHPVKGKPEGVSTGLLIPTVYTIGRPCIGGTVAGNLIVRNCVFVNASQHAIQVGVRGTGSVKILNNLIINSLYDGIEVWGKGGMGQVCNVEVAHNTILFNWSRTNSFEDMGFGVRCRSKANMNIHDNIIGLSTFAGVDGSHFTDYRDGEKVKCDNNIFFLNKQADMTLPSGGGKFMRIRVDDFEDVEQLESGEGNKNLSEVQGLKVALNKAFLKAFLNLQYSETVDFDPNSPANQFRASMGMNPVAKVDIKVSMFANRYPFADALKLFGAVKGCGAQIPRK